jgi:hypothetical protein
MWLLFWRSARKRCPMEEIFPVPQPRADRFAAPIWVQDFQSLIYQTAGILGFSIIRYLAFKKECIIFKKMLL